MLQRIHRLVNFNPYSLSKKACLGLMASILLMIGCEKKDESVKTQPPDTKISIANINLEGENRLTSEVTLNWSGSDQDGFVKGYYLKIRDGEWFFTQKTDSIFTFRIKENTNRANIDFRVKAVDNQNIEDPDPAYLQIPIKNTPPEAAFKEDQMPADTAFTVFPALWEVSDLDGNETIDSIYLKINDGQWYPFNDLAEFVSIVPTNPAKTGAAEGIVYQGQQSEKLANRIKGLQLNDTNTLYLKAKDIAGSFSEIDTGQTFYLKNKTSDLLAIGGMADFDDATQIFKPLVKEVYGNIDFINFFDEDQNNLPEFWQSTFSLHINLYDKLFVYTDDGGVNNELLLNLMSNALQVFLNQNNKLLVSGGFPGNVANNSGIFGFSPMKKFSATQGQARIARKNHAFPGTQLNNNYDSLQAADFLTGVQTFTPKNNAAIMYRAEINRLDGYDGTNIVCAQTFNEANTNQVFWSIPLQSMRKDNEALKGFFNQVLLKEFDW